MATTNAAKDFVLHDLQKQLKEAISFADYHAKRASEYEEKVAAFKEFIAQISDK